MNLLAAGATFGVLVLVFQRGRGANLLDIGTGPVEAFLPLFMLAILFGLSMDYHIFLVSRMHEEWTLTGDNRRAVIACPSTRVNPHPTTTTTTGSPSHIRDCTLQAAAAEADDRPPAHRHHRPKQLVALGPTNALGRCLHRTSPQGQPIGRCTSREPTAGAQRHPAPAADDALTLRRDRPGTVPGM
jgi:hypothetical protein